MVLGRGELQRIAWAVNGWRLEGAVLNRPDNFMQQPLHKTQLLFHLPFLLLPRLKHI